MLKPTNRFFLLWNVFLCFSIVFQVFSITIELFFDANWKAGTLGLLGNLDLFFKIIFIIDIFIRFNTGYFQSGEVVTNRRRILMAYIKSHFFIDVISGFCLFSTFSPLTEISQNVSAISISANNALKLLFLLNLVHLNKILEAFRELVLHNQKLEGFMLLAKLMFEILFIAHVFACLWNYCAVVNENSNEGILTWKDKIEWNRPSFQWYHHYTVSLYWSLATMITVGYGDVSSNNTYEQVVAISAMIIGGGFFAYGINSFGFIIQKMEEKEKELR